MEINIVIHLLSIVGSDVRKIMRQWTIPSGPGPCRDLIREDKRSDSVNKHRLWLRFIWLAAIRSLHSRCCMTVCAVPFRQRIGLLLLIQPKSWQFPLNTAASNLSSVDADAGKKTRNITVPERKDPKTGSLLKWLLWESGWAQNGWWWTKSLRGTITMMLWRVMCSTLRAYLL